MEISATVVSSPGVHRVTVRTGNAEHQLSVAPKSTGGGLATNGQALAEFAGIGLAASNVRYSATVRSTASPEAIAQLLRETDAVAEVHNTLRKGVPVQLLSS